MFDEDKLHFCYECDAEFTINNITNEEEPKYCPLCGSPFLNVDALLDDSEDLN
jgi:rRNA maturation endonuclease Nob1